MVTRLHALYLFAGMIYRQTTWHDVTLRIPPRTAWGLAACIAKSRAQERARERSFRQCQPKDPSPY